VRTITKKILHSSTILLPEWKNLLAELDFAIRVLPRDVKTRWNSTFDMINVILQYRRPVKLFTAAAANGLRAYELSGDEWTTLEDLRDALKHATLYFSRASATLASVVPTMDKIDALLATAAELVERPLSTAIKVALLQGKHTLNRYYSKTFESRVYRIAMRTFPLSTCNTLSFLTCEQLSILVTSSATLRRTSGRPPTLNAPDRSLKKSTRSTATRSPTLWLAIPTPMPTPITVPTPMLR
ncbi:hypothetical protein GGX14DRAFT_372566, partial [Mycena pura]